MSGAYSTDEKILDGGGAAPTQTRVVDAGGAATVEVYAGPSAPVKLYQTLDGGGADTDAAFTLDGGGAASSAEYTLDGGSSGAPAVSGYDGRPRYAPAHPTATFQGDPRLILGPDGSRLQFTGGQPLMDDGLENLVLISLFTNVGWCGNAFMNPNSRIGSLFEETCNEPITRDTLNKVRAVVEDALKDSALGPVQATVTNPAGDRLNVGIMVQPPGDVARAVTLTRNSGKWAAQITSPAYPHIRE